MAPSAVETTTNPVSETPKVKLYSGHVEGAYKELSPTSYIRESEEKGVDGHAAAKVSYIYLITYPSDINLTLSIPTIFQLGTQIKSILL
jgi:sulfonate dioxygenase